MDRTNRLVSRGDRRYHSQIRGVPGGWVLLRAILGTVEALVDCLGSQVVGASKALRIVLAAFEVVSTSAEVSTGRWLARAPDVLLTARLPTKENDQALSDDCSKLLSAIPRLI